MNRRLNSPQAGLAPAHYGKLRLQGIVLLGHFSCSRGMARTLDEIRRKRREAMRRYRLRLRPQDEPPTPTQIRQLRQRLGLSQCAFAARVGVYMGTIVRWKRGRTTPRFLATERLRELQRELEGPRSRPSSTVTRVPRPRLNRPSNGPATILSGAQLTHFRLTLRALSTNELARLSDPGLDLSPCGGTFSHRC